MLKKPILLASMLPLAACTVGPNYTKPDIAVPASFAGPQNVPPPGQAIDPARWWEAFNDPKLSDLIARALRDNPDMAAAASRVRQARLGEIQARAQYKPVVNADANATDVKFSKNAGFATLARAFSGGNSGPPSGVALPGDSIKTFAVGFDASWELDIFGGGRRGVEAALARTEAAEWNRRDAAVTLAAEVADAYFALRLDQEQIAVPPHGGNDLPELIQLLDQHGAKAAAVDGVSQSAHRARTKVFVVAQDRQDFETRGFELF